ncbi:MAG: Gfo/Idh/MocA family oxidoreductase [Acidobacteria bacterium]|nr:Gfo/Idh/MocA family oxidoreductase [Acidobacteriota bacterium]
MSELKIGVVGLGWVAGAHIETFKQVTGGRVTAVCSRRDLDPAALQAQYGTPLKVYQDYAQMLADPEIDAIDICTPHPFHAEQAIAAAQAGKHLIIEKPIALTWDEARRVRDAIDAAGVRAMVCFELRYSAQFTLARAVLDQGLLGDLHYGEVDYYHGIGPWYGQFPWNVKKDMGGSSLLTAGCHAMDILLLMMRAPVEEVTSYATTSTSEIFAPYEYPTSTVTIVKFAGGKIGKVASIIDCLQPYYFHTHLVGSHGTLLDTKLHSTRLPGMIKTEWSTLATHPVDSGDVSDHPYQPQFQAFVDATLAGERMPLTDFDTALETHRVVYAADLSAQRGTPVALSELA